jgi:twitching motility protein PilJ
VTLKFPTMKLPFAGNSKKPAKASSAKADKSNLNALDGLDDFAPTTIIADPSNTSGPVTIQADTINAIESGSGRSTKRRSAGFKMPGIGHMPLEKQTKILSTVIASSVVISFFMLWMDNRLTAETAQNSQRISDAMLHSQRLAKEIPSAMAGNPESFERIKQSRELVESSIMALSGNDTSKSNVLLPAELIPLMGKVDTSWQRLKSDSSTVTTSEATLLKVSLARDKFLAANGKITLAIEQLADLRMQKNAKGSEVGAYKQLILSGQRMEARVVELASATTMNPAAESQLKEAREAFTKLLNQLIEGQEPFAVRGETLGAPFTAFLKEELVKSAALDELLKGGSNLTIAQGAARSSTDQAEEMMTELTTLSKALTSLGSVQTWTNYIAAFFGLLALLAGAGLSKAYVDDSRKSADASEGQLVEAERLEQEAKRTNDQNQAAILRLMNELQEVADGDLTVQVTVSEDITGAIADSVNYTVEELRSLVSRINSTAGRVSDASSTAQQISTGLLAASEQQSREIRDTGESVLRLADSIHRVSSNALESAKVARHSLNAAEQGADAVHKTISGMSDIREQIQDTSKRIKRLGESSQEIGEIVELISDITEQTNVLALNAAIQAASAGEAGRGFTVVAEEVQRLAERSGEATKQISALIKTIQSDTQDAVAAMERSTQNVVEGAKLSDAAGQALGEIGTVSRQLAELIESISVTTNREAASAGTVAQSIQRILLVTEQTSEGTQQTADSVGQLTELAQDLRNSVTRFKVA